jgi:putative protease
VYAGLPRFNARVRGQNLSFEELSKLVGHAHGRGRRVYVTLNTLLKDEELAEALDLVAELALVGPDAIIVQDLGLTRALRRHFPELLVHASTQMAFHDSAGVAFAERLGIRRVILERQTTLEELAAIREKTHLELEVFVHGALCCSRSGLCLFSSWQGGWSGNRGRCKQPCRRRYASGRTRGYFFSPADLCALDDVAALVALGIDGLKIEGRLRRPDYVRRVVSAYRLALDGGDLGEARRILAGATGRARQRLFRTAGDFAGVIRHGAPGASGERCGVVVAAAPGGFSIRVSKPLHRYDTVRLQNEGGDDGAPATLTRLVVDGRDVTHAARGHTCWVPWDRAVEVGSLVFRTGSATSDLATRVAGLAPARGVVDLRIALRGGAIRVALPLLGSSWEAPVALGPARSRPLAAEAVAEQFRKSRSGRLAAGRIAVDVEPGRFLPAGELKRLRRDFWAWAAGAIGEGDLRRAWALRRDAALGELDAGPATEAAAGPPETVVRVAPGAANPYGRGALTARDLDEVWHRPPGACGADEVVLPELCSELDLPRLVERIAAAVAAGHRRFRATSLSGLALLLAHRGLHVTASFPVQACNRLALAELRDLGAARVAVWVELDRGSIEALCQTFGAAAEVMTHGRLPLLVTRMVLPANGVVTDERGARFEILRQRDGNTVLLPDRVLSIEAPRGASRFIDLTRSDPDAADRSDFNSRRGLV